MFWIKRTKLNWNQNIPNKRTLILGMGIISVTQNPNRTRTQKFDPYPIRNVKNIRMGLVRWYKTYPNPKCY